MTKNVFSLFVAVFLFAGFLSLALPEKGFSGTPMMPTGCCIGPNGCVNFGGGLAQCFAETIVEDGACTMEGPGGICTTQLAASPVPTLSEWGLMVMAGVLGIAGYMVIRRRKATV